MSARTVKKLSLFLAVLTVLSSKHFYA